MSAISVRNLRVDFGGAVAVNGVDLTLEAGRCLALVGESGSGKSVTARALVGLSGGNVSASELVVSDSDALAFGEREWRGLRGRHIGTVLQDALGSLDPLRPVGREVSDAARLAQVPLDLPALLRSVGLDPEAARRLPGELSGGMRQRALIAAALAADPELIIADEPTTALDTTRQAAVLSLLRGRVEAGGALLFITHDLAAARRVADDVAIMDAGRIVESGPIDSVLSSPVSEAGRKLVASVPWERPRGERLLPEAYADVPAVTTGDDAGAAQPRVVGQDGAVLELRNVTVLHRGAAAPAVAGASLSLAPGTTLGLVGESGSGKSTLLRAAAGLIPVAGGEILLEGQPWSALPERRRRAKRRSMAMIVQDPLGSFEPRWRVGKILADALGRRDESAITALLNDVHLTPEIASAHPAALSGGQRQRVAIARALAVQPRVLLCDEPVSALDASVQARVLDLLDEIQEQRGLSILLVSHDLGVIRHSSDNLAVLDGGRIVESGPSEVVLSDPQHPFTRELIAAAPRLR